MCPSRFCLICGIGNDPPSQGWAHKCLNSWQIGGFCLLGHYVTPLSIHKETDELPFSSHYRIKRSTLAGYQDTTWQNLLGILIPSAGLYVIRNLSATIDQIARDCKKHCCTKDIPNLLSPRSIR